MPEIPPVARINDAAMTAAYIEGARAGVGVRYIVISCVLDDDTFATGFPEETGSLRALQMLAQAHGSVSKQAGCEVTVMPLPTTGRSRG
jgi:hypothetical protein